MSQASRHNGGKPALSEVLLWPQALTEWVTHAERGRIKYPDTPDGEPNWTLGGKPDSEYLDAAMRHLTAMKCGVEYDAESGTTHAAAVLWNVATLIECNYVGRHPGVEPAPEPAPEPEPEPEAVSEGGGWVEIGRGVHENKPGGVERRGERYRVAFDQGGCHDYASRKDMMAAVDAGALHLDLV